MINTCTMEFLVHGIAKNLQSIYVKGGYTMILSRQSLKTESTVGCFLTQDDLKDLALVIGDRVCLRKILEEVRKVGVLCYFVMISCCYSLDPSWWRC